MDGNSIIRHPFDKSGVLVLIQQFAPFQGNLHKVGQRYFNTMTVQKKPLSFQTCIKMCGRALFYGFSNG